MIIWWVSVKKKRLFGDILTSVQLLMENHICKSGSF